MPVPFTVCGPAVKHGDATAYSEKAAAGKPFITAESLFETFIRGTFK